MTQPLLVIEKELKTISFELDLMNTRRQKLDDELSALKADIHLRELEIVAYDKAIELLKNPS